MPDVGAIPAPVDRVMESEFDENREYTKWYKELKLREARIVYKAWFKNDSDWESRSKKFICETFVDNQWRYEDNVDDIEKILSGEVAGPKSKKRKTRFADSNEGDEGDGKDKVAEKSRPSDPAELMRRIDELQAMVSKLEKNTPSSKLHETLAKEVPEKIALPRLKKDERIKLLKGLPKFEEAPKAVTGDPGKVTNQFRNKELVAVVTKTLPMIQRLDLDVFRIVLHIRNMLHKGEDLSAGELDELLEKAGKLLIDNCKNALFFQKQVTAKQLGHAEVADLRDGGDEDAFWQEEDSKAVKEAEKLRRDVKFATQPPWRGRGGRGRGRGGFGHRGNFRRPWRSDFRRRQFSGFGGDTRSNFSSNGGKPFNNDSGRGRGRT